MDKQNLSFNGYLFDQNNEELNWESLWKILRANRWFVLTAAAIAFSLSTFHAFLLPNMYTAETTILIERNKSTPLDFKEMVLAVSDFNDYYGTRVEVLKSRPILEQTSGQLNLVSHYRKTRKSIKTNEQVAKILRNRIRAEMMKSTQLMKVRVEDTNPQMSAKIANALAENFIKESWRERFFISKQLLEWFPEEAETIQRNNSYAQLRKLDRTELISSLPSLTNDPVLNAIKQDQRQLAKEMSELSRHYTDEHPTMRELHTRMNFLESEMKAQTEKIIAGLKAALAGEFSASTNKVVESAVVPTSPSGPPRPQIILFFTLLALGASIAFVVLTDRLNRNIRGDEDIKKISLPLLGHLPFIVELDPASRIGGKGGLLDLMVSNARLADEITNIRTSVLFSTPPDRSKLLMCTSALPQEGKSFLVSMLSLSLAETGEKVLLVDADLRNPSLHRVLKLKNRSGLSDCLVGATNFRDVIQVVEKVPTLHVITAGGKTPNPVVLLGSPFTDDLLQQFTSEYDRVIFDVPPALQMADALILAGKVHATILVFQSGKIHQDIARKLVEKINLAKGLVIGAVLNRVDYEQLNHPYYDLYRQYSKYYQDNQVTR